MEEAEEVQREAEGADLWELALWRFAKKKDRTSGATRGQTTALNFQNKPKTIEKSSKTNSEIPEKKENRARAHVEQREEKLQF